MPEDSVSKEWFNKDQRILIHLIKNGGSPETIKEVSESLEIPRTTVSDHLKSLSKEGLIDYQKEGRKKKYYVKEDIIDELLEGLTTLHSTYVNVLDKIKQKELEKLEELKSD